MSDEPRVTIGREQLEQEFAEFRGLVKSIRDAIEAHGRAHLVRTNTTISPGLLMSALLNETAMVCAMWGEAQRLRPEEVEDVFNRALRNAKDVLRQFLSAPASGATPTN